VIKVILAYPHRTQMSAVPAFYTIYVPYAILCKWKEMATNQKNANFRV